MSDEIDAEWPVPAEPVRIRAARSYRILVVDDDPAVATGTVAMLDDLGHCAIESGSAEEALRLSKADPGIEIVITDHAMPGMTGTELAAQCARSGPTCRLRFPGYAELPPGCSIELPHLHKPYGQKELASLLSSLLKETVLT